MKMGEIKIWAVFLVLVVILVFWVFIGLFVIPSLWSVYMPKDENSLMEYYDGYYNPNTDQITIVAENGTLSYKLALEHEECHRQQNYRGSNKSLFWREMECYIKEWRAVWK